MKRTLLSLLAATAIVGAAPSIANAQSWMTINERQAQLDQRLDIGVRSGQLTVSEASRLRAEFQDIARLEQRYRMDGLSVDERADLDRRFDMLSGQIRVERSDRDRYDGRDRRDDRWMDINERQAQLDQRIDIGVRSGQLTASEAARLRAEFQDIARLESRYRTDGLSENERADLDRRFDMLSGQIRVERSDRDRYDGRDRERDDDRGDRGERYGDRGDRYDRGDRNDQRRSGWENLRERQTQFQQRLDRAVSERRITQRQAYSLRTEFQNIANLERQYRRDGISRAERADLDRRFERLRASFRASVQASQYDRGYGQAPNLFDYLFGVR